MRGFFKKYGKGVALLVVLAVVYFTAFGTGLPYNELDFSAEQVESVEILDTWMSPAKVTVREDIQFLIDAVNDSKRSGILPVNGGGHPLDLVFHRTDGETVVLTVFPQKVYGGSPLVDLERGTTKISPRNSFTKLESTMYFTCMELAYKYNPDGNNRDMYERWIERGYIPRLKETAIPSGPAVLPLEKPLELSFSSGAGAWATWITLNPDGTFEGGFHDSDMGDMGEDYPNGTVYYCNFSGSFETILQKDIFSYSMQLKELHVEDEGKEGDAYIDNGVRYILSTPYGMEDGEEFIFYMSETPVSVLSGEFLSWWPGRLEFGEGKPYTLERYGLWNVSTGDGFFS